MPGAVLQARGRARARRSSCRALPTATLSLNCPCREPNARISRRCRIESIALFPPGFRKLLIQQERSQWLRSDSKSRGVHSHTSIRYAGASPPRSWLWCRQRPGFLVLERIARERSPDGADLRQRRLAVRRRRKRHTARTLLTACSRTVGDTTIRAGTSRSEDPQKSQYNMTTCEWPGLDGSGHPESSLPHHNQKKPPKKRVSEPGLGPSQADARSARRHLTLATQAPRTLIRTVIDGGDYPLLPRQDLDALRPRPGPPSLRLIKARRLRDGQAIGPRDTDGAQRGCAASSGRWLLALCDRLPLGNGLMTSSNREQHSHRRSCILNRPTGG